MSLGRVLYSVQTMLPEAGGQVGEVPEAVSWVWRTGAPYGRWIHKLRSESASTFPSLLGLYGPSM